MHEWGIAQNIMGKIAAAAREHGLICVKQAKITLGRKLGIGKDEFLFCLKHSIEDKRLQTCEFIIEEDDSSLACLECVDGE